MSSKWKVKAGLHMLVVIRTMCCDGQRGDEEGEAGEAGAKG